MLTALLLLAAAASAGEPSTLRRSAAMKDILARYTVRQRVGPIDTPLPLEAAGFLLDHPDMAAWLVRRHGLAPYVIVMRGPGSSWADDGDGTSGFIDLVSEGDPPEPERRYYTEGTHRSPVFPDIHASAVIVLDLAAHAKPGCPAGVRSSFDVYVKLRSRVLSGMVKVLRPFIRGLIVRKFTKAFSVAHQVGVLLAKDPEAIGREMASYPGFSEAERQEARSLVESLPRVPAACF